MQPPGFTLAVTRRERPAGCHSWRSPRAPPPGARPAGNPPGRHGSARSGGARGSTISSRYHRDSACYVIVFPPPRDLLAVHCSPSVHMNSTKSLCASKFLDSHAFALLAMKSVTRCCPPQSASAVGWVAEAPQHDCRDGALAENANGATRRAGPKAAAARAGRKSAAAWPRRAEPTPRREKGGLPRRFRRHRGRAARGLCAPRLRRQTAESAADAHEQRDRATGIGLRTQAQAGERQSRPPSPERTLSGGVPAGRTSDPPKAISTSHKEASMGGSYGVLCGGGLPCKAPGGPCVVRSFAPGRWS